MGPLGLDRERVANGVYAVHPSGRHGTSTAAAGRTTRGGEAAGRTRHESGHTNHVQETWHGRSAQRQNKGVEDGK